MTSTPFREDFILSYNKDISTNIQLNNNKVVTNLLQHKIENRTSSYYLVSINYKLEVYYEKETTPEQDSECKEINCYNTYEDYIRENGIVKNLNVIKEKLQLEKEIIILKPVDYIIDDSFIEKWREDKNNFNDNIIQIYVYGSIYDDQGNYLNDYIITKRYGLIKEIKNLDFNYLSRWFHEMIFFIKDLTEKEYIFRNLMSYNIGYDIHDNLIKFIFVEYNSDILVKKDGEYMKDYLKLRCLNKGCGGNLIPYYVMHDYYYDNKLWLERLDKLFTLGIVEIILIVFYKHDENLDELYKFLTDPSKLESNLQYFHYTERFNSEENREKIKNLLLDINFKFCNINPIIEPRINDLLMNLLEKNYDNILDILNIYNLLSEIFVDIDYLEIDNKDVLYNPNIDIDSLNYKKRQEIINGDNIYKKKYIKYKKKYIKMKDN